MNPTLPFALAGLALVGTVSVGDESKSTCSSSTALATTGTKDIVETAIANGSFETLVAAVQAAGLVEALQGKGPFTVFAPSDEAFAKLPEGTLADLLKPENKAKLQAILTYHVVPANVLAKDVIKLDSATTLNGQRVTVRTEREGGVFVDGANVIATDVRCTNGTIHVIDSVLLPSFDNLVKTADNAGSFTTLLAAAKAAGLAETLAEGGPFTILAPTDAAFAKLPEGTVADLLKPENKRKLADILKFHVIPGRVFSDDAKKTKRAATLLERPVTFEADEHGVRVQGANVTSVDIQASNGVIHVIDTVLLP